MRCPFVTAVRVLFLLKLSPFSWSWLFLTIPCGKIPLHKFAISCHISDDIYSTECFTSVFRNLVPGAFPFETGKSPGNEVAFFDNGMRGILRYKEKIKVDKIDRQFQICSSN